MKSVICLSQTKSIHSSDFVKVAQLTASAVSVINNPENLAVNENEYEISSERGTVDATNRIESLSYLIKGSIGLGVMGMGEAFKHGGLWTSLVMSIIIALMIYYTNCMLINSAHKMYKRLRIPRLSYPELAEQAALCITSKESSKYFRHIVEALLFTGQFTACTFTQIIIAHTVKQLYEQRVSVIVHIDHNLNYYIIIVTGPLLCLSQIRQLKFLALFSFISDFCILGCIGMTLYYSVQAISEGVPKRPNWKSWDGMLRFSGGCIYAIDGLCTELPIENHMKEPEKFLLILKISSSIVLVTTVLVGALSYIAWGEKCTTPVTSHMPDGLAPFVFQVILAIMLIVTFALHFFVQFRIVWYYLNQMHSQNPNRLCYERLYRIANVCLVTLVSVTLPDIYRSMSTIGPFLFSIVGFALPAAIETMVTWKEHRDGDVRWVLIKNIIMVSASFTFAALILISSI